MSRKLKLILHMILIFITVITLLGFTLLMLLKMTVLNSKYTIKILDKNDYYQVLYDNVKEEMSYYTLQSGFGDDIIDDTFTKDEIKDSVKKVIEDTYHGVKTEIDVTKFEERMNTKIDNFVLENNFKIINKDELYQFTTEMSKVYVKKLTMNGYFTKFGKYINKIIKLVDKIIMGVILLLLLCLGINVKVFKLKNFGVVLFTNSFLLMVLNVWIKKAIPINNIFIYNDLVSSILKNIISNILDYIVLVAVIYFALEITFIVVKTKKKK